MDRTAAARAYYDALDAHDYDALADLLSAGFVHDRPELTLEGRERFLRFMREERPNAETTHELAAVAATADGVLCRGLVREGEAVLVAFVDAFAFADGRIARVTTYTT